MKITIPVEENSTDTKVCMSFGRTPYFLLYDTDTQKTVYLDNIAASSQGGAGIKAAQMLVDNKIDVVITPRCGENAAKVLNTADIKIYRTINDIVKDNIEACLEEKLSVLDNIHPGFHHHGG